MKSTTFIAILLTLLTLLLVTGAGAFFLVRDRQDSQREAQLQQLELEGHVQTINDLQTTAAAREMALATGEAQAATQEAQITADEALLATREAELSAALAATPVPVDTPAPKPTPADRPPRLEIVHPLFGASVAPDTVLPIIVIGSADEGIASMELLVGDRPPIREEFDSEETYTIFRRTISNLSPGSLVITATMTTNEQETERTTVRIFVQGDESEQDGGGTQGWRAAPVAARPN